jgi:hypothetical protein
MHSKVVKLAPVAAGVLIGAAFALPAAADVHHYRHHHFHHVVYNDDRPWTVHGHSVVATPDPYHNGDATIVTGPNAVAATVIGLPFRVANTLFPYEGNSPLVIVGAPVHVAGQVAEFPFYAVGSVFGAPPSPSVYY